MSGVTQWPFDPLRPLSYGVILADPPWSFRTWGERNEKSPSYSLMTMADLKALPVGQLATSDCALIMWAVQAMMPQALDLMTAWGFRYKTMGAWAKQSSTGKKWAFGTGYVLRCAAEFYIIGTMGKPDLGVRNIRNLIVAPVREHSRKPDEMHANIERLFPCTRRAELFGRESKPGWDVWGNQSTKFDEERIAA